jgi:hypothetical protein
VVAVVVAAFDVLGAQDVVELPGLAQVGGDAARVDLDVLAPFGAVEVGQKVARQF